MDWAVASGPADRIALAQTIVALSAKSGWSRQMLERASSEVTGLSEGWRRHFPRGCRDAIWFISEVSDKSMGAPFAQTPAREMTTVIGERLAQNADLKPFVRSVMMFDLRHPVQALGRMQRTAEQMVACVAYGHGSPGRLRLTALNLLYTLVIFRWLFDTSPNNIRTHHLTRRLMRILRL